MKMIRISTVIIVVTFLLTILANTAIAQDLYVVASKATQQASQNWAGFLQSQEISLRLLTPEEFTNHKNEKYIIIMGGIDEPQGVKGLLKEVLTEAELQWISKEGNGGMYLKSDVWAMGQSIIIFAGSDWKTTEQARKAAKEEWFEMLANWFDLEVGGPALPAY